MFSVEEVLVSGGSKYQPAGVSEKVTISEVDLVTNEQYNTQTIVMKTMNEDGQEGKSKKLSLKTTISEGKKVSAWTMSARYLMNLLMSVGYSDPEARAILTVDTPQNLVKNLTSSLVGKEFKGLFSSREYEPGKAAIELYTTEKVGGNKLVWDPTNVNHNSKLPTATSTTVASSSGLPF